MKKILLLTLSALILTGCNQNYGITQHTFNRLHIYDAPLMGPEGIDVIFTGWADFHDGIEVYLTNGSTVWVPDGRYLLINGTCPICNQEGK